MITCRVNVTLLKYKFQENREKKKKQIYFRNSHGKKPVMDKISIF